MVALFFVFFTCDFLYIVINVLHLHHENHDKNKGFTAMRPKIDMNKLKHLPTAEDMFVEEYGAKGTVSREEFDAKSRAWYYAEVLKNARKSAGITQQQLADKIGKKREYVAMLEKGETDMQLSTFIMISEAVGLKFALTY